MSIDLTLTDGYDVRKRIGRAAYSRKVGSKKNGVQTWKSQKPVLELKKPDDITVEQHSVEMPRNKKLNNKRRSRHASDVPQYETREYQCQQMLDAEEKTLRKLKSKLNRQAEKQLRRARRSTPKVSTKKPSARKHVNLEEDFCLNTVYEDGMYFSEEDENASYQTSAAPYDHQYIEESNTYEDAAEPEEAVFESTCQTYAEWAATPTCQTYVEWAASSSKPMLSTCQTFTEWVISKTTGTKKVAYDETADKDDWENAENHANSEVSSMFGGCTTASVNLSGEEDEFLLLDDNSLLDVMNNQNFDADQKQLEAWELV